MLVIRLSFRYVFVFHFARAVRIQVFVSKADSGRLRMTSTPTDSARLGLLERLRTTLDFCQLYPSLVIRRMKTQIKKGVEIPLSFYYYYFFQKIGLFCFQWF